MLIIRPTDSYPSKTDNNKSADRSAHMLGLIYCIVICMWYKQVSYRVDQLISGFEVIKLFMLNSDEHEIYPAHEC